MELYLISDNKFDILDLHDAHLCNMDLFSLLLLYQKPNIAQTTLSKHFRGFRERKKLKAGGA